MDKKHSHPLYEKKKDRVLKNGALRRIFGLRGIRDRRVEKIS
jgi:hypothetical protein